MIQIEQENSTDSTLLNRKYLPLGVALILSFIFCYAKLFATLVGIWWEIRTYSHGFLIPFISFYLVWIRQEKLQHIQIDPSYFLGIPIMVGGLFMLLVGHVGGVLFIQQFSLLVTIVGITLLFLGAEFLRALWFPITYLSFMLTIWGALVDRLHLPFQYVSAFTGTRLLQLIGIPAHRESIYIELPNITLEVADVCSGVNGLIAVVAIGLPLAYLTLRSWPRRVVLVSGAVAIAILGNGLRVALIGTLSYYNMAGDLHGPYHILQAMIVTVIGFIALFIGAWVLSRKPKISPSTPPPISHPSPPPSILYIPPPKHLFFLTIGTLLIVGGYINFYSPLLLPLKIDFSQFPYEIGRWKGENSEPDYEIFRELGVDHELTRNYRTTAGKEIKLYVGYYESQKQGKELVHDKSKKLHFDASETEIMLGPNEIITVKRVIRPGGRIKRVILFWYDINGRIITDRYKAKVYTAWYALTERRTNGAVIMVSWDIKGEEVNQKQLFVDKDAEDFIRRFIPILRNHIP